MTILEQSRTEFVDALQRYRAELFAELQGADVILESIGAPLAQPKAAPPAARTKQKPGPKPKAKKASQAKRPAKAAKRYGKLAAPKAIHDPVTRIGKLSTKCQIKAIEDDAERRKFVEDLVAKGYTRTKPMQRMAPGLFDVCHRDGAVTVTWWPEDAAA